MHGIAVAVIAAVAFGFGVALGLVVSSNLLLFI